MSNIAKKIKEREKQKLEYYKEKVKDLIKDFSEQEIQEMLKEIIKDQISPKIQSESGREFLANLLGYIIYTQLELMNKTKDQIYYLFENYDNQRRLTEAIRESNQLSQNKTNFLNTLKSIFIQKENDIPAQITININRLMPEPEKIEEYIEHIPEGEL